MAINKVIYGDDTLIDLTSDNVSESDVLSGKNFHKADGSSASGSIQTYSGSINITPSYESQTLGTKDKILRNNIIVKPTPIIEINDTPTLLLCATFAVFDFPRPIATLNNKVVQLYVADNSRNIQLECVKDDGTDSVITLATVGNVLFSETFEIRRVMYVSSNTALIMYRWRTAQTDTETSYSTTDSAWYVRSITVKQDGTIVQSSQLTISATQLYTENPSTGVVSKNSWSDIAIMPCLFDNRSSFLIQRVDVDNVTGKKIIYANYMYLNLATNALALGSSTWTTLSASNVNSNSLINYFGTGGFSYTNASGLKYIYIHGGRNTTAKNVAYTACGLSYFQDKDVQVLGLISDGRVVLTIDEKVHLADYDPVTCYFKNFENLSITAYNMGLDGGPILIGNILISFMPAHMDSFMSVSAKVFQISYDYYNRVKVRSDFNSRNVFVLDAIHPNSVSLIFDTFKGVIL